MVLLLSVCLSACQGVNLAEQQATATAFANSSQAKASILAEKAAMALCEIDFTSGKEFFTSTICDLSTSIGCTLIGLEIDQNWEALLANYGEVKLGCKVDESRLLERGRQFGNVVEYWLVKTRGVSGWPQNGLTRSYWLQLSEDGEDWKLNRMLEKGEITYYSVLFGIK